jgi:hypothetical protein
VLNRSNPLCRPFGGNKAKSATRAALWLYARTDTFIAGLETNPEDDTTPNRNSNILISGSFGVGRPARQQLRPKLIHGNEAKSELEARSPDLYLTVP